MVGADFIIPSVLGAAHALVLLTIMCFEASVTALLFRSNALGNTRQVFVRAGELRDNWANKGQVLLIVMQMPKKAWDSALPSLDEHRCRI